MRPLRTNRQTERIVRVMVRDEPGDQEECVGYVVRRNHGPALVFPQQPTNLSKLEVAASYAECLQYLESIRVAEPDARWHTDSAALADVVTIPRLAADPFV